METRFVRRGLSAIELIEDDLEDEQPPPPPPLDDELPPPPPPPLPELSDGNVLSKRLATLAKWPSKTTKGKLATRTKTQKQVDDSTLRVLVRRAHGLRPSGARSTCSAYVVIIYSGQSHRSRVIENTMDPAWNETAIFFGNASSGNPLKLRVYGRDSSKMDELLGEVDCSLEELKRKVTTLKALPSIRTHASRYVYRTLASAECFRPGFA